MNAFKAARTSLASSLSAVHANVYEYPPEMVGTPAVVVVVDDPMAEPIVIGSRLRFAANYRLMVCVAPMTNLGSLEAVEALVIEVLNALPATVLVGPVAAPIVTQVGQSDLVVCEIPVQIQTAES
jgi:hypothetical protein